MIKRNLIARCSRDGFTLIELLLALAIMAMVAVAVTTRSSGKGKVSLQQSIEKLESIDQLARTAASKNQEPTRLRFDLINNQILIEQASSATIERVYNLPSPTLIKRVITSTEDRSHGEVTVAFRSEGSSQSYAVQFGSRQEEKWILIAGGAGQFVTSPMNEQEKEVKDDEKAMEAYFRKQSK